jgi:predicted dithiol-disulfide oxidoreductase (DUF899 family)
MSQPQIVSPAEWQAARAALLLKVNILELTPFGRQEAWEDAPPGWPQGPAYTWWRRHDEYEATAR